MSEPALPNSNNVSFGPFILTAEQRLLSKGGEPVRLGGRALDLLIVLTARPNTLIGKRELLAMVWPDVTVDEGSLRFHVANLRKALGDGKNGARYIATLAGRGYCFVAPVSNLAQELGPRTAVDYPHANLPGRLTEVIGRAADIAAISALLDESRFVTLVGTGGVGKTTAAVAVGHARIENFAGAVHFVDLGALHDPGLVAMAIATTLGLAVHADDMTAGLVAHLADKRILLILDTCEHVIDAAAAVALSIVLGAPQSHVLATSREALRGDGEQVYRLDPLACPPVDARLDAAAMLGFPASQLLLERATANGARGLGYADAALVADICRKLDGVPLAIELAAGRVAGYGLQQTAALLDQRLTLLWPGLRTAPDRQKTLQATLDWSFQLLSELERTVLARLAVFVGPFTIEAAQAVVVDATLDPELIFGAIDGLVAKSMVAVRPAGAMVRYRLLDATRTYARPPAGDDPELAKRHALHFLKWLEETGPNWPNLSSASQRALHLANLANVRAALEWSFGKDGSIAIAVRLATAAAPVFLAMSLLVECHRWSERAIAALDDERRDTDREMHLQAALGVSLMFTRGGRDAARAALERSAAIADRGGTPAEQLQMLAPLHMYHLRTGAFDTARRLADRCGAIAGAMDDPGARELGHTLMGFSFHLAGELDEARGELEAALATGRAADRVAASYLGFDGQALAGAMLARTLWLQGHLQAAARRARQTIEEVLDLDHPLTLSITLIWCTTVFLGVGDLDCAEQSIEQLLTRAEPHSLAPHLAVGRGLRAELARRRGDPTSAADILEACLAELHAAPYELLTTPLNIALARALAESDRSERAARLIEECCCPLKA